MSNPYIARGPLQDSRMFYGRAHELNEIAAFLQGNQSVSIIGPRKIGKTSLLFHLMRPDTWTALGLGRENLFVYLDCAVLTSNSPLEIFARFCTEMSAALKAQRKDAEPALQTAIANPTRIAFEIVVRRLNQRGLRVVLMLDEFERLSANANLDVNFFNALRSEAGRFQFVLLTASTMPLIELTYVNRSEEIISSPFFNIFAPLFLGLLREEDARGLIRTPMETAGIPVNDTLENFIYEMVGGHPFALQVACFHACERPHDLAEVKRWTLEELDAHLQYSWNNLSPVERDALRHLSETVKREGKDPEIRTVLRALMQKCLLLQSRGAYNYPSEAWAEFVEAHPSDLVTVNTTVGGVEFEPIGALEHESQDNTDDPDHRQYSRPNRIVTQKRNSARSLIRQSLPEFIGGITVTAISGLAWLVYQNRETVAKTWGAWLQNLNPWTLPLTFLGVLAMGLAFLWFRFKHK